MDLDMNVIGHGGTIQNSPPKDGTPRRSVRPLPLQVEKTRPTPPLERHISPEEVQRMLREIVNFSDTFNRRLKFSVNRELNQVVVKVIDRETDKVIKEIPHEGLQRLHVRLKEAMGLLFDEEI